MRIKRTGAATGPKRITLNAHDVEELQAYGRGKMTRAELGEDLKRAIRLDSVRAYRRQIDTLVRWVMLGRMGPKDALAAAQVVKTAAELLMTEKVIHAAGQTDEAPPHILGADGGAELYTEAPEPVREVEVTRTTGTDAKGNPIDMTTATVRGGRQVAAETPLLSGPDMNPFEED